MTERGEIGNRELASQIRSFRGLRFNNITPTDIDGLIEYKKKGYILFELKRTGAILPDGQRWAIERMVDDLNKTKPSIGLIAEHDNKPPEDIDAANSIVKEYRYEGSWHLYKNRMTLRDAIGGFIDKKLEDR